jgi:hypothetical protein
MTITNRLKGYRTFIAAAFTSIGGTLAALPDQLNQLGVDWKVQIPTFIPIRWAGLVLLVSGLVFGLLRIITTTPPACQYHPAELELPKPPIVEPQ